MRMPGTWAITRNSSLSVHSFTAPEDGWLVNSHIVQLSSHLLVIDAQYSAARI